MPLQSGTRIGGYEIIALVGAGGMGEVYRARDTRLGRDVAIKTLSPRIAADRDAVLRFEREARALATLNHPNIAAIHDVVETTGQPALVLELVDGQTLADRIAAGPLSIGDAIGYAKQIADALDIAHESGIVHRDLKPANLKVTEDGRIKVLDFGLAKAIAAAAGEAPEVEAANSPTITVDGTRQGVILGTAAYMSPEQARGKRIDKRTDIWAFGCVLYEMLTRRPAFAGETTSDVIAAIIERAPDLSLLPAATPANVRRLLERCLDKDPRRRLRDIGDARAEFDDARITAAPTAAVTSSPRSARLAWLVAAASIVALLSFVSAGLVRPAPAENLSPRFSRIVPVTTGPAREHAPAISPDGKWVAYVSNLHGRPDIWVKFLAGGEAANLTASAGLDISHSTGISGLDISPDGTRIAVMAKTRGSAASFATWEVPAPLPGVPRKLLDDGLLGMRWAPDGRQITFIRAGAAAGDALWVAEADGTNKREIIPARDGIHIHWPTWSRDGFIYFIRTITTFSNLDQSEIYRIDSRGGQPSPVVTTLRRAMYPVTMPGGDGLIYAANPIGVELGLWWRAIGGGDPQRLSFGTGDYAEPRISADGRKLVATRFELRQSLVRVALTPAVFGRMTGVTDGYGGDLDPSISPSGDRVVFSSSRAGDRHLWTARIDGADLRPLTSGNAQDDRPAFSPDGKQIAFHSDRDGRRGVWIIGADGGTPRKVADVSATGGLSWSPDGKKVVYAAGDGGWPGLWSVVVENGQVHRIATPGAVSEPAWNPVRDLIAYLAPATSGPGFTRLSFVDSGGKAQYETLPPTPAISGGFSNGMPAWSPDGRRLAVVSQNSNAMASIWIVDPESSTPFRKLAELPVGPRIRGVAWTRDGAALIIGQHDTTSDIVLLDQGR